MRLLVIDDNKSMTKLLSRYCEMKNLECVVSNDGVTACQLINDQKFDAILLDLAMPEFSGWDVIGSLKKTGKLKEEKIFVLTASSLTLSEIEQLKTQGVKACVKKPVRMEELLKIIEWTS